MTFHPVPTRLVVMGVAGCGKSSLGQQGAAALGLPLLEGDDFHPAANVAKMRAGVPLSDEDRAAWLDTLAQQLASRPDGVVLTCSSLKRRYRDRLRRSAPDALFVLLDPSPDVLRARDSARTGHFMPASLLDSQLATLERPDPDERAIVIVNDGTIEEAVDAVLDALKERGIET